MIYHAMTYHYSPADKLFTCYKQMIGANMQTVSRQRKCLISVF